MQHDPFSPQRAARDLLDALPAVGILLGALGGALVGALDPAGSVVTGAGIGIVAGLCLGLLVRRWRRG